jgi:hypothetical protein
MHRGSQRKAEMKEEAGIFASLEESRVSSTEKGREGEDREQESSGEECMSVSIPYLSAFLCVSL